MHTLHPRRESGFTFAELAFSMVVLVIAASILVNHLAVNFQATNNERDRVFAYAKAQAILSELQNAADRAGLDAAIDLDIYDDGVTSKNSLTIQEDGNGNLLLPDHVISGNYQRDSRWVWARRIQVQPFVGLNNRNVRYVTVRIFKRDSGGNESAMADLSAVINSSAAAYPTTQVFDVYLVAVENIPGWWVYMDTIRPFVESMITDLESRNPGLEYRTHWITKASYGRNLGYRPYINETNDTYVASPDVYHYPGRMPSGSASSYYYVPGMIKGHVNLDGEDWNGYDATTNPHPYALADYFNHAMRYPDELAVWQQHVADVEEREAEIEAARLGGTTPPAELSDMSKEPTLRLFLEDLYSDPSKYRNAMIVNLHGELLPMPALRNYSDAARDPVNLPHIRCVTHPEELRTLRNAASPASSDSLTLRMYAYTDNVQTYSGPGIMSVPMVVEVVGLDLTDPDIAGALSSSCTLSNLPGGVSVNGSTAYASSWQSAKLDGDGSLHANEMYYRAEFVNPGSGQEPFTRIYLYNTPVIAPLDAAGRGLALTERAQLYWMSYIPCPVEAACNFSTDLSTISTTLPKNTARWKLRIAPAVYTNGSFKLPNGSGYQPTGDVTLKVRTRIWSGADPANSGTMWPPASRNTPDNLSVTYAWWADSLEDVPITERSQFNGDPRHLPYRDCFNTTCDYPNAYNWYHDSIVNNAENGALDYPSIDWSRLRNRWNSALRCDAPRYTELLRSALEKSSCVWTTLTGWSYYYLGVGADIGYDSANGYPNSIPCQMAPYGASVNGYINTITSPRTLVRAAGSNYWWGMPWLGELFPDTSVSMWATEDGSGHMRGNLTPGTATGQFYQAAASTTYSASNRTSYGVAMQDSNQRMVDKGCTAVFNIGTSTSTFNHVGASGNGTMSALGLELAQNYNTSLTTTVPISRPWGLNKSVTAAEHWNFAPYTTRSTASIFKTYISHASGTGSGLVKLVDPAGTNAAYVVVNGIDATVQTGTSFIAKWAVLSLTHSFFEAGNTSNTLRIQQLPRVEISYPNDISELLSPAAIDVQFGVSWTRWDGLPYTQTGTFSEDESQLEYVVQYSRDGGETFLHVEDDSPATPGVRPNSAYVIADSTNGSETYTWDVPAQDFPQGSYVLRVDCFRHGAPVHYAYHQTRIFIQR